MVAPVRNDLVDGVASPEVAERPLHGGTQRKPIPDADRVAAGLPGLPLQPAVAAPLGGAFAGAKSTPAGKTASWGGPVVQAGGISERVEKQLLHEHGGKAVLAAFGGFDPAREPLVLVHGITGSGEELTSLAARLTAAGRQVFILFYADVSTETHLNGLQLAGALVDLRRRHYAPGTRLDIVGHSMGGIVARCALNYLQDPHWMKGPALADAEPRAGFGAVRFRSLDTPWDGYPHESYETHNIFQWLDRRVIFPIVAFFMRLFGFGGYLQMRGSSDMFRQMYTPRLSGVDFRHHAATQTDEPDFVRSVPELTPKHAQVMARFIVEGELPHEPRLRNLARAVAADARYAELQAGVRRAVEQGRLDLGQATPALAKELGRVYEQVMPRFVGSHATVVADRPGTDGLVHALVTELGAR